MTTITALPTPPSRDDPANFASRADDFLGALPDFVTEANAVAGEVNTNASNAQTYANNASSSASTATTKANEALSSANSASSSASLALGYKNDAEYAAAQATTGAAVSTTGVQTLTNKTITYADNTLMGVQPSLVSGTNIKTVNGGSILGSGDLTVGGMPSVSVVAGTTQAAAANTHYVLTNASATTVTLPASPADGDIIWVTVANARVDNVIARNGKSINGVAEDMTVDAAYATVQLRYIDSTRMWRVL